MVKLVLESKSGEMMELVRHHSPAPLGELALLDGGPREVTAEAVERSILLVVTRSAGWPAGESRLARRLSVVSVTGATRVCTRNRHRTRWPKISWPPWLYPGPEATLRLLHDE